MKELAADAFEDTRYGINFFQAWLGLHQVVDFFFNVIVVDVLFILSSGPGHKTGGKDGNPLIELNGPALVCASFVLSDLAGGLAVYTVGNVGQSNDATLADGLVLSFKNRGFEPA
jgi:hypothetical protein